MDILTFLSKIFESLSWPGTVLLLAWFFRNPVTNLINRIRSFHKEGDKFSVKLDAAIQSVPDASEKHIPDDVKSLTHQLPIKAVEKSWEALEETATYATQISMSPSLSKIADTLINKDLLTKQEAKTFYDLGKLKDEALSGNAVITDVSSGSYASIAYTLADKIKGKKT